MQGCDDDQWRILDPFAQVRKKGLKRGFAKFGDVGTCDKRAAIAYDDHRFDAIIGFGPVHSRHKPLTDSMGQCIDRGVTDPQNGNVTFARISNLVSHLAHSLVLN